MPRYIVSTDFRVDAANEVDAVYRVAVALDLIHKTYPDIDIDADVPTVDDEEE